MIQQKIEVHIGHDVIMTVVLRGDDDEFEKSRDPCAIDRIKDVKLGLKLNTKESCMKTKDKPQR